jgi:hypothetical protein
MYLLMAHWCGALFVECRYVSLVIPIAVFVMF